jgi:hypothetical protein
MFEGNDRDLAICRKEPQLALGGGLDECCRAEAGAADPAPLLAIGGLTLKRTDPPRRPVVFASIPGGKHTAKPKR